MKTEEKADATQSEEDDEEDEEGSSEEEEQENHNSDRLPPLVGVRRASSPAMKSGRQSGRQSSTSGSDKNNGNLNSSRRLTTPLLNLTEYTPPKHYEFWIRCMDINQCVYYYNNKSGESTWLAPCAVCYKSSDKFCVDCKVSYCDLHFYLKHKDSNINLSEKSTVSGNGANNIGSRPHQWMAKELPQQEVLKSNEVYCIECNLKRATKMCTDCWDAYCNKCYDTVHHVGALKYHRTVPYEKARAGWMQLRDEQKYQREVEDHVEDVQMTHYYVHGFTKEQTRDKPKELMSELERVLLENYQTHKEAAERYVQDIEELQVQVEQYKYERDRIFVEVTNFNNNLENSSEAAARAAHIASLFAGARNKDEQKYRSTLMNVSNRKRGESRTTYIKELLDMPLPGQQPQTNAAKK